MAHFSKYIRPKATIIGVENSDKELQATAAQNLDGSIAVVVFNEGNSKKSFKLLVGEKESMININAKAIQTILINNI